MQRIIHKFIVLPDSPIEMPRNAELLSVQMQNGSICLWAKVDPSEPLVKRKFHVQTTGGILPSPRDLGEFIGTVQMGSSWVTLVLHVFAGTVID